MRQAQNLAVLTILIWSSLQSVLFWQRKDGCSCYFAFRVNPHSPDFVEYLLI